MHWGVPPAQLQQRLTVELPAREVSAPNAPGYCCSPTVLQPIPTDENPAATDKWFVPEQSRDVGEAPLCCVLQRATTAFQPPGATDMVTQWGAHSFLYVHIICPSVPTF